VDQSLEQRLRIQDHIERNPVVDFNAGGEYLLNADYSLAAGLFTSRTAAPDFLLNADGTLDPRSSRPPRVSLYGGTAPLGLIGQPSNLPLGTPLAYGRGDDPGPHDPNRIIDPPGRTVPHG